MIRNTTLADSTLIALDLLKFLISTSVINTRRSFRKFLCVADQAIPADQAIFLGYVRNFLSDTRIFLLLIRTPNLLGLVILELLVVSQFGLVRSLEVLSVIILPIYDFKVVLWNLIMVFWKC